MELNIKKIIWLSLVIGFTSTFSFAQIWQPLAKGIPSTPTAVTVHEGQLAVAYTLGYFKEQRVHEVALWNGVYWSKLPTIFADSNSVINALLFKEGDLYIAGKFARINGSEKAKNIVRWNGKEFEALAPISAATSNSEFILHLSVLNDMLVVAGSFKNDVITGGNNLAFYKNDEWVKSPLSLVTTFNGTVFSSLLLDGTFYTGGKFTKIGTFETNYLGGFTATQAVKSYKNEFVPIKMVALGKQGVFWGEHATNKAVMPAFFAFDKDTLYSINEGLEKVIDLNDIASDGQNIYATGDFKLAGIDEKQNLIQFVDGKWQLVPGGVFQGLTNVNFLRGSLFVSGTFKSYKTLAITNIAQYLPNMGVVTGKVFFDKDANCVFNSRDEYLKNVLIRVTPGDLYLRPNDDGAFTAFLKEGKYTFTIQPQKYWSASPCDKLVKTVVVINGQVNDTVNYALMQDTSIRDLSVKLNAQTGGIATRKNVQQYFVSYENLGSNEVNDGVITLHFDKKLEKLVAEPKPDLVQGDSALWNVRMLPGVSKVIKCQFVLSASTETKLNLSTSIKQDKKVKDIDQDNNQSSLIQTIQEEEIEINKQVNPGKAFGDTAYIAPNVSSVDYQISFSNFSGDTVRTVHVVDTITLNHSLKEIRETGASHPYSYQIIPGKAGENVAVIIWTFHNINLAPNPTKNGEIVNDDGFISFRIGLKSNLNEGVILQNKAQVAFDYSNEKHTNSVFAMITDKASVWMPEESTKVTLYPNPTSNTLHLNTPYLGQVNYQIYRLDGCLFQTGNTTNTESISVQNLPAGIFIIRIQLDEREFVSRFVRL